MFPATQINSASKIWQTGCYKAGMNMRLTIFTVLCLSGLMSVWADEKLPVLEAGGDVYSNVNVTLITATDVYFTYNNEKGMANAKLKSLSPELQKHFHYNQAQAGETEQQQAQANTQYHEEIVNAPATASPPDESRTQSPTVAHASDLNWSTDFSQALEQARADDKRVLLDFTGSDWCPWCIKFDHEVLDTDPFAAYAQNKLELVLVDFPRTKPQSDELKQANQALGRRYNVSGYPTFVLVNYAGNELGRQVGYAAGGPSAFITELEGFSQKQ
jgi:thioredoxin-related protein